jgi:hypothetical protein
VGSNCWSPACASPLSCHLSCLGSRRTDRQLETSGHVGVACGEGMHGLTPVKPQHRRTASMGISISHAIAVLRFVSALAPESAIKSRHDRTRQGIDHGYDLISFMTDCSTMLCSHLILSLLLITYHPKTIATYPPLSADSAPNTQLLHLETSLYFPLSIPHQPCCSHNYCATLHVVHLSVRAVKATLRCLRLASPLPTMITCPALQLPYMCLRSRRVLRCAVMVSQ